MFRKRHPPVGARPGTLMIHSGAQRPRIHVMKYHPGHLEEHDVSGVEQLRGVLAEGSVCWIDVQGLGDETLLRALAEMFSIHSLALENVVNVPQRPKVESYESHTL
jgi:magnesium transporter